jgi:hypothetical protein
MENSCGKDGPCKCLMSLIKLFSLAEPLTEIMTNFRHCPYCGSEITFVEMKPELPEGVIPFRKKEKP